MNEHLLQMSVHAYYAGEREVGMRSCERLLASGPSPDRERIVRRNRTWYTDPIQHQIQTKFVRIDVEPPEVGWSLFNPTIARAPAAFLLVVRSSNYRIVNGQYVTPPEDKGTIRTKNVVATLTDDLRIVSPGLIDGPIYRKSEVPVDGLEDCRLNRINQRWYLSGTVLNVEGHDGTCRIATAELFPGERLASNLSVLPGPVPGRHEKNWMPIEGTHRFLYAAWEDGKVATATRALDGWQIHHHGAAPMIARGFRGGSQLIHAEGSTYLALVHEVAQDDDGRRTYEHRFVAFDVCDGIPRMSWLSTPFVFRERREIEFAAGLARRGDQLLATFGVRDEEAWVAQWSLQEVLSILRPVGD